MKIGSTETLRSRSVPAPRAITRPERAIADHDEPRDGLSAPARWWARIWARPSNYAWATGVVAVGLGLHFYDVREMLVSLALFSLLFFSLTLVVLSVLCICYAGNQAGIWGGPASRALIALFQQQDRGGAELVPVPVVEDGPRPANERSEV